MAKQTEIGYEAPTEYKPYQTGGTLIRASELNAMNGGIADACAGVDELRTKRLPTYVVAQDGDTATQDVYAEPILGPCLILDLATRTTYYEDGTDEEGHRKAITSGDDIDGLRDSLSQLEPLREVGDLNSVNRTCFFCSSENAANTPEGAKSRFVGFAVVVSATWCSQFVMNLGYGTAYVRGQHDGSWTPWSRL